MAKASKKIKTNAMRILDQLGLPYEVVEYPVDEKHLDALHVAESIGENPEQVYKTIVMLTMPEKLPVVFVVAADREVDLKKTARLLGVKKVEPLPLKDLQPLTGYIRGGCTAIGMKNSFSVIVSQEFLFQPEIFVSGGQRGVQIKMNPEDYRTATRALPGDIATDKEEAKK